MVRTQVQLTEEQAEAVKRLAADEGVSVAEIIRQSVEARIRQSWRPSDAELRQRARALIGIIKDGPTDMARNHDEYALEAYES